MVSLVLLGLISFVSVGKSSATDGSSGGTTTFIELPALDYAQDDLEPYISEEVGYGTIGCSRTTFTRSVSSVLHALEPAGYMLGCNYSRKKCTWEEWKWIVIQCAKCL